MLHLLNYKHGLKLVALLSVLFTTTQAAAEYTLEDGNLVHNDGTTTTQSSPIVDPGDGVQFCEIDPGVGSCSVVTPDSGTGTTAFLPSSAVGNPISLLSGNKFQSETDFNLPNTPLMLRRMYNTGAADSNLGIGQGWRHTYSVNIVDTGNGWRRITQSNGAHVSFKPDGEDEDGNPVMRATQAAAGYMVFKNGKHHWFVNDGRTLIFKGSFLVRIEWPDHRHLEFFYSRLRLKSVTDETGRALVFAYNPSETGGLGKFIDNRFDAASGHISSVTLPGGSVIGYDYDQNNNLTRVRFPDGSNREYHYENEVYQNHLTGLTDRTGARFASWVYDEYGRGVLSEHAGGVEQVAIEHPSLESIESGEIVESIVINSLGGISTYKWQMLAGLQEPRLLSSDGPGCASCPATGYQYTYDDSGRLLSATKSGEGNSVGIGSILYRYDEFGRTVETRRIDAAGFDHLIERHEFEGSSSVPIRTFTPSVNPQGERLVDVTRDERGLPIRILEKGWAPVGTNAVSNGQGASSTDRYEPIERTTSLEYERGKLVSVDGPRTDVDDITRYVWDEQQRLERIEQPNAPTTYLRSIDALGRVTRFQIGQQSPVIIEYGSIANTVNSISQHGRTLSFLYDAEYRIAGFTSPDGQTRRINYNDAGLISELIDDNGQRTRFEYDSEGRRIGNQQFGFDGTLIKSVDQLFDTLGRVTSTDTQLIGAMGSLSSQRLERSYNSSGQMESSTNVDTGDQVSVEYNAFGQLASISEPALNALDEDGNNVHTLSTGFEYDTAGNESALIDARNNRTQFLSDDFGRVVILNSPDTGITRYSYDAANNRIEKRKADGAITSYTWDAANRMIGKVRPDGEFTYSYSDVDGKLIESVAPDTTERFAYDVEARLARHERTIDGQLFITEYERDSNGRISLKRLPDGQVLRYHYRDDELGLYRGTLKAITRQSLLGLRQETLIGEIDQDGRDGASGHVGSNGLTTQTTHGPDGSIVSMNIDQAMQIKYEFDDAGRITGIDLDGTLQQYQYSSGGLSYADTGDSIYRFDYDHTGNRVASSIERSNGKQEATLYSHSAPSTGNQLQQTETLSVEDPAGTPTQSSTSLRFDANGAPIARAGLTYEYDPEQRPVRVLDNGKLLAEYAYNGFGERIRKVIYSGNAKKVTYFFYEGKKLTAEISDNDEPMRHAVFLDAAPVAYFIGRDIYTVHSDHLGTPRVATNAKGETVWSADYAPFGKATIAEDTIDLPYRYSGQYFDSETETHYNYYRDYDPATGRYITSDPIGLKGGLNTYAYVLNNPLGMSDPLGLNGGETTGATGESPANPDPDSEGSYADKLEKVFNYAFEELKDTDGQEAAAQLMKSLAEQAAVVAGVVVAVAAATAAGYGAAALGIVAAMGWVLAGYEAGKFVLDAIKLALRLRDIEACNEEALKAEGVGLAVSVRNLATELTASVLLGGLSKIAGAVRNAANFAKDGAFSVYRQIRALIREDVPVARLCSFAGDTLVVTQNGYREIQSIRAGKDRVWARDEQSGKMGWRDVLAHYSNRYEETVHVTAIDSNGHKQTIRSNRIHPYFARVAVGAVLASASLTITPAVATEGHVYQGEIAGGAWVDAQHLEVGDLLLSDDNQWQTVEQVEIEASPLDAYNLTVDEFSTYFVAGDQIASGVWVHNDCFDTLPNNFKPTGKVTDFEQPRFVDADGNELYRGHDGRYYDLRNDPPTANVDRLPITPPRTAYTDYKQNGGDLPYNEWWTKKAPDLYTSKELKEAAESTNWKDPDTGKPLWPPFNGFDGLQTATTIKPGDNLIIDRYSENPYATDTGAFFGTPGATFAERAMSGEPPPILQKYKVTGDLEVIRGDAAPWFGHSGGSTQYLLNFNPRKTIAELVAAGILTPID